MYYRIPACVLITMVTARHLAPASSRFATRRGQLSVLVQLIHLALSSVGGRRIGGRGYCGTSGRHRFGQGHNAQGGKEGTKLFYGVLLSGCQNKLITEILRPLFLRIKILRSTSLNKPKRAGPSLRELEAMYQAIATRKPLGTKELTQEPRYGRREVGARGADLRTCRDRQGP